MRVEFLVNYCVAIVLAETIGVERREGSIERNGEVCVRSERWMGNELVMFLREAKNIRHCHCRGGTVNSQKNRHKTYQGAYTSTSQTLPLPIYSPKFREVNTTGNKSLPDGLGFVGSVDCS